MITYIYIEGALFRQLLICYVSLSYRASKLFCCLLDFSSLCYLFHWTEVAEHSSSMFPMLLCGISGKRVLDSMIYPI